VTELDIVWTWGPLFYLLFPALEITSPKAWLCAHYGYCSLQFCGICFSQWFSSEEISGSSLLLLAYPLWTTTAGRIGETYSYTLV